MSSPDWFRWYPVKWLSGVLHLNNEQRGVYIQVINVLLDRGECSADPGYLGRLCNCNRQKAARIVGELISAGKLEQTEGKLHQNRAQSERKLAAELSKSGADLAAKRWRAKHLDDAAPHMQTTIDKKDSSLRSESTETPAGVDQPDLDALFYRRGKALLGQKAGGQLTKLRAAVGLGVALEVIEAAHHKDSPVEYVAGVIRNKRNGASHGRSTRPSSVEALRRLREIDQCREERIGDDEGDGASARDRH